MADNFDPTAYHVRTGGQGISLKVESFNLWYTATQALWNVDMDIEKGLCTALIGPSGCGKSTLLRAMNRMNDLIDGQRTQGQMLIEGEPIYGSRIDVIALRKRMGMVFQKPNPFPMSITENVIYPLRVDGVTNRKLLAEAAEAALRGAALWDEVKNRLKESALSLSRRPRSKS
jgi:phosphate transport system ATP-binding protein